MPALVPALVPARPRPPPASSPVPAACETQAKQSRPTLLVRRLTNASMPLRASQLEQRNNRPRSASVVVTLSAWGLGLAVLLRRRRRAFSPGTEAPALLRAEPLPARHRVQAGAVVVRLDGAALAVAKQDRTRIRARRAQGAVLARERPGRPQVQLARLARFDDAPRRLLLRIVRAVERRRRPRGAEILLRATLRPHDSPVRSRSAGAVSLSVEHSRTRL